ncbi:hypothetical protein [Shewanella sp. MEBiC00475]|uniref:hypothetical protein n=1 Tax=Shewanella sp. MEBiC00475 TaxID=2575361 RepID=UPI0010C14D79|nr:hypothetical protein [Shewanella sp. MEBiC00475]
MTNIDFETLFAPYLSLRLSAFDNVKLIAAVLSDAGEPYQCIEAHFQDAVNSQVQHSGYFVRWKEMWIFCGITNDYNAAITLVSQIELINTASIIVKDVPIMTMQQVSFMCIETAHFDHC